MELNRIKTYKDFVGELQVTYKRTGVSTKQITQSKDVIDFVRPLFDECMDDHEEVKIVHLNRLNKVVNVHHHSKGGTAFAPYDVKLILQQALLIKTEALVIIHNHPSGGLIPSQADKDMSRKLKEACKIVGLVLLDSLIITRESYYSLGDNGLM